LGEVVGPRQSDCGPANFTTSALTWSMKSSAKAGACVISIRPPATAAAASARLLIDFLPWF
jgi:hypothetical protein